MLSYLRLKLLHLVRARPLVSVTVRRGRYSLGYSPDKGGAVAATTRLCHLPQTGLVTAHLVRRSLHPCPEAVGHLMHCLRRSGHAWSLVYGPIVMSRDGD